jgi:hypothetical protein
MYEYFGQVLSEWLLKKLREEESLGEIVPESE